MSLRAEIHDAIDEVTPHAPMLRSKTASYVETETHRSSTLKQARTWTRPLRGSLGLIAAVLAIALFAGALLVGRYWHDLNSTPQPVVPPPALKSLEQRPVLWQALQPGAACPTSPIVLYPRNGLAVGNGPVYFIDRNPGSVSAWGSWEQLRFAYLPGSPGIVLIRGWDLGSNKAIAFVQDPLGPSRITAAGANLGQDQILDKKVQRRSEAYFVDPAHSASYYSSLYPLETVMVGVPKGASGCVDLQFDGDDFTENLVISWSDAGL